MDAFVSGLMSKMTLDEKIGQLNLVTSGRALTGSVVNKGVEESIKKGRHRRDIWRVWYRLYRQGTGSGGKKLTFAYTINIWAGCNTWSPYYFPYTTGYVGNMGYGPDRTLSKDRSQRSNRRRHQLGFLANGGYCP